MSDTQAFLGSGPRIQDQGRAATAATKIGRCVKLDDDGKYAETAADDPHPLVFVFPDLTRGQNADATPAADDEVTAAAVQKHQRARVRVHHVAAIVVGDLLQHNGSGALGKRTGTNPIVAIADEALAATAGATDNLAWVRGA